MVNKKCGITIAAIACLLSLLSVAYLSSCTKHGLNKLSCEGVICQNGGFCDTGTCVCPVGYEGANCSIASVTKFLGTWDVVQKITDADSPSAINNTTTYTVFIKATATPTTFFINNLLGNAYYNDVVCTIDSVHTNVFVIDTLSDLHMIFNHLQMQAGWGSIASTDSTIDATLYIRFINGSINWQRDSITLHMTPHHF